MSHHESHFAPQTQRPIAQPVVATTRRVEASFSDSEVAKLAFAKFEARGRTHGFDKEDWAAASRELGAKGSGRDHPASMSPGR